MATTAIPHEVEHLQGRVRLYLLVMLIIDVAGYVSDLLTPLNLQHPEWPLETMILRWAVTPLLLSGWAYARFAKPTRRNLVVLESVVTLLLVVAYTRLGLSLLIGPLWSFGPLFALVGVVLLLVVRAALVPSPVYRTVVIGLTSFVVLFLVADETLSAFDPLMFDAMTFLSGAFLFATAATSHVIYGLRAQVRQAMRLGQYELGRKLGEGGMGVVYEATHVMLRRPTAVKLLPVEKAGEQTIARFEREVRQTSRLEHPNSVYIYDYGRTPDGQFYYAMEYLDGVTLEELVALDGAVGAARVASILDQAARALAEAHGMGLVHRDIKPANIMLCVRAGIPDTVKVLDFGLVKAVDNPTVDDKLTQANAIVGTPHYLSPETITNADDVGPPSDVYALGAIGYFLVTGREVFTGRSLVEVCSKHLSETPEPPSAVLGTTLDPGFEGLILRCLEKQPDERPRDGAALARELEDLHLAGWSAEDARAWWRELPKRRHGALPDEPTETARTQLAVDVVERR